MDSWLNDRRRPLHFTRTFSSVHQHSTLNPVSSAPEAPPSLLRRAHAALARPQAKRACVLILLVSRTTREMATAEITNGAIRAIMSDQVDRETFHPILQVALARASARRCET